MSSITRWIPHRSVYYKIRFVLTCIIVFITIFASVPAFASGCDIVIPSVWKEHFPFDLIYPIGSVYNAPNTCPTINFWGENQQVCAIPQLTAVLKNVILANIAIKGLFAL
jgi:hypothetical protein